MDGMKLIREERRRQIDVEGFTSQHDAEFRDHVLHNAARSYEEAKDANAPIPKDWPWAAKWWKPKDRLRNLVRAGALYQAAQDRARLKKQFQTVAELAYEVRRVAREIEKVQDDEPELPF